MTYIPLKTRSHKNSILRYKTPLIIFGLFCCVLFILRYRIYSLIRTTSGISNLVHDTAVTKKSLIKENDTLKQRIRELESITAEIALLREENTTLTSLLKYTKNPSDIVTTALVVGKPSSSLFDTLVINQGNNAGVVAGDLVVAGDSILLGVVKSVTNTTAKVDLYSRHGYSHDSGFMIKTLGINVQGRGNGNENFIFEIPASIQIVDGDVVTLPEYPDRVVAVIKSVDSDPRNPFQKALARTPVNINELKFVQVVRP